MISHGTPSGEATADIREWPWQIGAPVQDGDGDPNNYDFAAGDRPQITGHQMLWWVMNDLGGPHGWGKTAPLGIEVHVSAFAVLSTEPAIDHATFYRYRIVNKQDYAIDSVYVGWWVDADLGNEGDDLVGSDTSLGMGFIYNGDNDDEGPRGYGANPPALGVDFVQGPLADTDNVDNDGDGSVDEDGGRLQLPEGHLAGWKTNERRRDRLRRHRTYHFHVPGRSGNPLVLVRA